MKNEKQRILNKYAMMLAVAQAVQLSKLEPHRVLYVVALKCPGCHRHVSGLSIASPDTPAERKPKYTVATVVNGQVIGRTVRIQ